MSDDIYRGKRSLERFGKSIWIEGELDTVFDDPVILVPKPNGRKAVILIVPNTLGRYTKRIDKNGKKIFDGDIIKIVPDYDYSDDYSISKVYSYNGIFCVDYHGDDFDSTALGFLEDYLPDGDFEVIGNIHDNPELLEVGE